MFSFRSRELSARYDQKTRPDSHTEVFLHYANDQGNNCLRQYGSMDFREMKSLWMVYRREHRVFGTFVHALCAMSNQRLLKSYSDKIMEDLDLTQVYLTVEGMAKLFGQGNVQELRLKKAFLRNCENLALDCYGITITADHQDSCGHIVLPNINVGKTADVKMTIKNTSLQTCRLNTCMLLGRTEGFSVVGGNPFELGPFRSQEVTVKYDGNSDPQSRVQVIVGFEFCTLTCPEDPFHIVRIINVRIVDDLVLSLSGLASTHGYRARRTRRINYQRGEDGRRPPMPSRDQLSMDANPLRCYTESWLSTHLNRELWLLPRKETGRLRSKDLNEEQRRLLENSLSADTYEKQFLLEMLIEQRQQEVDIHNYDREGVAMQHAGPYLLLEVPGLAENRPSLLKKDFLIAVDPVTGNRFKGYVHWVEKESVRLQFSVGFHGNYINGQPYNIEFSLNPTTFRMQCRAIAMAQEHFFQAGSHVHFLFPDEKNLASRYLPAISGLRWFDQKVAGNPQQMTAVHRIVDGTSGCAPYLVFGPPGTGKTVTVVEAIKQVYSRKPSSHILACTPSNSAADLIVYRLIKDGHVHKREIVRLNAYSRSECSIADDIRDYIMSVSCYDEDCGSFFFPSLAEIQQKRIVVCTLFTSGRLVSAGMPRSHFDYIFVDESGHAVEPECLIPIAGMLNADKGRVVLAGDPQQLGPIVRSSLAKKSGLAISLLERLMERPLYKKSTTVAAVHPGAAAAVLSAEGSYNENAVTKLLQNYRSHPAILRVPNKLFYDNELQVCADEAVRECLCKWEHLAPKAKENRFPIVFHGVVGKDMQTENSPSFFNPEEVRQVVNYVRMLRECRSPKIRSQDIGVISPYHLQVINIRRVLKAQNFDEVKVGSVEEFQGQERLVIIISTVRSQQSYLTVDEKFSLGFLKQRKRFNVAITRAKALLIVIGNPLILVKDENWKCFIDHCKAHGACKGVSPPGGDEQELVDGLQQLNLKSEEDVLRNIALRQEHVDLREDAGWRQQENPE